jgi:hypothetical protein
VKRPLTSTCIIQRRPAIVADHRLRKSSTVPMFRPAILTLSRFQLAKKKLFLRTVPPARPLPAI